MTTTIELPDSVYDRVKAQAARQGTTVEVFLVSAIRDKLAKEEELDGHGWRSVFGKGDKEAVAAVQRIIDDEFSKIDPEEQDESKPGLMSVFGKGDKEAVADVQRIIDDEFSSPTS